MLGGADGVRVRPFENPFRMRQLESLTFRPQGTDWPTLERRLEQLGRRGAIIGPEGSGKTTLLRQLGERLAGQGYRTRWVQITRDRPTFPRQEAQRLTADLSSRDIILFDGAGHLLLPRWWAFRWRAHAAGGLLITAHSGRRLPPLLRTRTDVHLLAELMRELFDREGWRVEQTQRVAIDPADLYRRHGGNMRTALREMYDHYAGIAGPAGSGRT